MQGIAAMASPLIKEGQGLFSWLLEAMQGIAAMASPLAAEWATSHHKKRNATQRVAGITFLIQKLRCASVSVMILKMSSETISEWECDHECTCELQESAPKCNSKLQECNCK